MISPLLVKAKRSAPDGVVQRVTPASAGWTYVGFEAVDLAAGQQLERTTDDREVCVVLISGRALVAAGAEVFGAIGDRASPFEGKPWSMYVPARSSFSVRAESACEVALGSAPAVGRLPPRLIPPTDVAEETRGQGTNARYVRNILPDTRPAESLLVVEVITPGGHWSSYPPHKHDSADGSTETQLEETYYHRLARPGGFAFQRVYTDDRSLDETIAVEDRDIVLVPRGYHPVGAPHGIDLYYLNVMAGPVRRWLFRVAPGYDFQRRST